MDTLFRVSTPAFEPDFQNNPDKSAENFVYSAAASEWKPDLARFESIVLKAAQPK